MYSFWRQQWKCINWRCGEPVRANFCLIFTLLRNCRWFTDRLCSNLQVLRVKFWEMYFNDVFEVCAPRKFSRVAIWKLRLRGIIAKDKVHKVYLGSLNSVVNYVITFRSVNNSIFIFDCCHRLTITYDIFTAWRWPKNQEPCTLYLKVIM